MSQTYAKRIDGLLDEIKEIRKYGNYVVRGEDGTTTTSEGYHHFFRFCISSINLIEKLCGIDSIFYDSFPKNIEEKLYKGTTDGHIRYLISTSENVLIAIKNELESGLLLQQEKLYAKDIMRSIKDEAEALLNAGYKDAAAVYCRVMIESSIKKICDYNNISYNKKTKLNTLLDNLKEKKIINTPEWRQFKAWIDIGNAGAHGNFNDFDYNQVSLMLKGIDNILNNKLS